MSAQDKFSRFLARHPHDHTHFWRRPVETRRQFFRLLGAGVSGYFFWGGRSLAQQTYPWTGANVETQNRARNVVFILLAGAASHVDTFDYKPALTRYHNTAYRGDCAVGSNGRPIGKGIVNYSAGELRQIKGMRSEQVRELLPHASEEAVHRDYFVLT